VNVFDPELAATLERLAPAGATEPDWADVLARARGGSRSRRGLAAAALLAALALLAAPALGLRTLIGGARPHLQLVARLEPVAGTGSGSLVLTPAGTFTHPGSNRVEVWFGLRKIGYALRFQGLSGPATSARLVVAPPRRGHGRGYTVRLCAPCTSGFHGVIRLRRLVFAVLARRATVEVDTARHPDGELRGRILARR